MVQNLKGVNILARGNVGRGVFQGVSGGWAGVGMNFGSGLEIRERGFQKYCSRASPKMVLGGPGGARSTPSKFGEILWYGI